MATSKNKRKLQAPKVADKELSRIVDNIYDELNKVSSGASQGPTSQSIRFTSVNQSQLPPNPNFNNVSLDTLQFDTSYVSTELESQGTLYWNQDEETLSLVTNGETIELGQKIEVHVKNQTGSQIDKGEVVYASGTLGASGRILVTKMIADGTIAAKRILGVAAENIANGADGKVVKFGKIRKVDTSAYSNDDILWVSTTAAGAFQNTEPVQADGEIALPIAYVVYSSASNGEIFVRITPIDENEYQNYDAGLADIAGLTPTDSTIIVGDGTNWVAESGDTARTSLGLGTGDSPTFSRVVLSNQADDGTKAVRADRSLAINPDANNVITFDLTGLQDLTSNRTWTPTIADHANGQRGVLSVNAQTIYGAKTFNNASTFDTSILLDNTAKFESEAGFIAGFDAGEGFRLKRESGLWELELDDMYIRGALFASEFIVNQISAVNGSDILSPGRGKVEEISSNFYTVSDPQGGNFASFAVNDIVIVQQVQPNDNEIVKRIVKQVIDVTDNVIELATLSGAPTDLGSIEIGDIIVAIGSTSDTDRQANIFRTVTDSDSPYVRVNDGISSWAEWTGVNKLKVQYGKLDGLSSLSSNIEGYGLYAENTFLTGALLVGDLDKAGNYLEYNGTDLNIVTDTFDLDASTLVIDSATNSGKIALGATPPTAYNSGTGIYFDGTGKALIGNASGNKIQFNGTSVDIESTSFSLSGNGIGIDTSGDGIASANPTQTQSNLSVNFKSATSGSPVISSDVDLIEGERVRVLQIVFDYDISGGDAAYDIRIVPQFRDSSSGTWSNPVMNLPIITYPSTSNSYFNTDSLSATLSDESTGSTTEFKVLSSISTVSDKVSIYIAADTNSIDYNTYEAFRFIVYHQGGAEVTGSFSGDMYVRKYCPSTAINPEGFSIRQSDTIYQETVIMQDKLPILQDKTLLFV
jgi:hypothetical protein